MSKLTDSAMVRICLQRRTDKGSRYSLCRGRWSSPSSGESHGISFSPLSLRLSFVGAGAVASSCQTCLRPYHTATSFSTVPAAIVEVSATATASIHHF